MPLNHRPFDFTIYIACLVGTLAEKQPQQKLCRSAAGLLAVRYDLCFKFAACTAAVKQSQKLLFCNVNLGA
jgi:hypothetical protein